MLESAPYPSPWFLRINGVAHAFSRQLGCSCARCKHIDYAMAKPPGIPAPFGGWPDPPWRANTSVSLLFPDSEDPHRVGAHVLFDVGAGVVKSLAASGLHGLERLAALFLTHWHPDHVIGENMLGECIRRADATRVPICLYCHEDTFAKVAERFPYDMSHNYCHVPFVNGVPFKVQGLEGLEFTAIPVRHGKYEGCVMYVVRDIATGTRVLLAWDIDGPRATMEDGVTRNVDVFGDPALADVEMLVLDSNTFQVSHNTRGFRRHGTGHTSFLEAWEYVQACRPLSLGVVHLSGHEDWTGAGMLGHGWTDEEWHRAVSDYALSHPVAGRQVHVHRLLQGTVLPSSALRGPAVAVAT